MATDMAELHVIDADPSRPPSCEAVVSLANHLLAEFNIPTRIVEPRDISASFFVVLYESLFSDQLPGIIRQPVSNEDEIHNCQTVIDVLSTDVIRDSLSHIRATDIVAGDMTAISNLLDIFSYLLEYVVKRIESDLDDTRSIVTTEADADPSPASVKNGSETVGKKMPLEVKNKVTLDTARLNKTSNNGTKFNGKYDFQGSAGLNKNGNHFQGAASLNKNENRKAYDDHKVISHEDYYAMTLGNYLESQPIQPPSPIKLDQSTSLLGQKTVDSEFESLVSFEKKDKSFSPSSDYPKIAWDNKLSPKMTGSRRVDGVTLRSDRCVSAGAAVTASTAPLVNRLDTAAASNGTVTDCKKSYPWEQLLQSTTETLATSLSSFSASLPPPSHSADFKTQDDPLHSTVGPITYHMHPTPQKPKENSVPAAKGLSISYSDLKQLVEKTTALTRIALETSPIKAKAKRDLKHTDGIGQDKLRPTPYGDVQLTQAQTVQGHSMTHNRREPQGNVGKKVAFVTSKSDLELRDRFDPPHTVSKNNLHNDRWRTAPYGDQPLVPLSLEDDLERRYTHNDVGNSDNDVWSKHCKSKPIKTKSKLQTLVNHLVKIQQPELGKVHLTLKAEDKAIWKKQEILRKFYEKDHEEFKEDIDYVLSRDAQKSKETEEEYVQKCIDAAIKNKPMKKAKRTPIYPSKKRCISSKLKRKIPDTRGAPISSPLKLESEEDLLPLLLEDFPHLHLSEHTWHELWRKGLWQIEALTRAYQESQRKKSRAKSQLGEAAEKHELLSDIMRKQLEHAQRMQEIKEQKQLLVQSRNKVHEKRIQSARARRYYNEYQVRSRAKQLKRRTKEELVFRELFKDALNIQKERIKDIRQYSNDQRKRQETRRRNEIDSLENFYQDQFEMLASRLARERLNSEVRETAQKQMMESMKRELRQKMEAEIRQYQEQMFRDDDDAHFRQMDADKVRQRLHSACYSARI